MDQFTTTKCEKMADEISAEDFSVDYSAKSVFSKNPIGPIDDVCENSESLAPKAEGLFDILFVKLEKFLSKNSKTSPVAKRLRVMLKFFKVKDTLGRLNKINKSVDELVNLKVPFGESDKRYQILANRLIRANHLHSEIQRELA